MARYDNPHSRFVAYAKVALPLVSLGLLTTMFLFTSGPESGLTIPYARVDLETLAREQRLENPSFSTVTDDGAELTFAARRVRPDLSSKDVVNSNEIDGELRLPDASSVTLRAQNAMIDGRGRLAELSGGVEIVTSTGYHIATDRIAAQLDVSLIESPTAVTATGPAGQIEAGSLIISRDAASARYRVVFKDGVKLIYRP